MITALDIIIVALIIVTISLFYLASVSIINLVRHKGTPQYRAWRRRAGKLGLADSIERGIAIFLVVNAVIIITLFILWGKNQ